VDERRLILVVEDDDLTRAFLLDNLAADGFRVAGASGAGEGLRAIEVRQPALVVLDLTLEDGSGLALLDRVRAADGLASRIDPDLPVIVLSGRSGDEGSKLARVEEQESQAPLLLVVRGRASYRRQQRRPLVGGIRQTSPGPRSAKEGCAGNDRAIDDRTSKLGWARRVPLSLADDAKDGHRCFHEVAVLIAPDVSHDALLDARPA
jgi:DNA-binding response OmpR family regulator